MTSSYAHTDTRRPFESARVTYAGVAFFILFGAIFLGSGFQAVGYLALAVAFGLTLAVARGTQGSLADTPDAQTDTDLSSASSKPTEVKRSLPSGPGSGPEYCETIDGTLDTIDASSASEGETEKVIRVAEYGPKPQELMYEPLAKIGEGAMGEVWRVRHIRLGRLSALKTVRGVDITEAQIARFEREAKVTASLRSPHTVIVHDFGTRADGSFYYAMENLVGFDLQTYVEKFGPIEPERAAYLLAQACHSLEEAHQAGLVHRDFKPSNLMLCRHGIDVDFLKVVDFGLVKVDSTTTSVQLTSNKAVLGTAAYLPPESLTGSKFVDARADLYSLGCVAFWLLTGRLLFPGNSVPLMAKSHVTEIPPRVRDFIPNMSPEFDDLIAQCLSKKPEERPASAGEVRKRLSALQFSKPWNEARAQLLWQQTPELNQLRARE